MLASISPVGEAARHQRWTVTVLAYLVASTFGGATVGALFGTAGAALAALTFRPDPASVAFVLAGLGVLAMAIDLGLVPVQLPAWQRQVDERWLTSYRGWVYGAGFGAQLGGAVFTRIPTAVTHLWLVAAAATFSPILGATIGATFGLVRAVPLLLTGPLRDPGRLQRFHARLQDRAHIARRSTNVAVSVTVSVTVVAALVVAA